MKKYDLIIIGAGAAGLSAARAALANEQQVLILDMGDRPARKVSVSGGGRCNFTNTSATRDRYFGQNPDFVRSALAQVTPHDILDWVGGHNIDWVEKSPGQFFCATSAQEIVNALTSDAASADIVLNTPVTDIEKPDDNFIVHTDHDTYTSKSLIIATGGTSYPSLMVSDFGMKIAKKFGHKIIPIQPGLVGLKTNIFPTDLSGISLPVKIKIGSSVISDSLLFTHFGIGGPAAYRASLLDFDTECSIDFLPDINIYDYLIDAKKTNGRKSLYTLLSEYLPARFAKWLANNDTYNIADYRDIDLQIIADDVNNFKIPRGILQRRDLQNAEVITGGVSTDQISSKTMESKLCPGLFFAGEVIDIAGDLGGFNLHFAFASGIIAGKNAAGILA